MITLYLGIFAAFLLVAYIAKVLLKRRMNRALGRTVKDHELTSLNSWMEATENEERDKNNK